VTDDLESVPPDFRHEYSRRVEGLRRALHAERRFNQCFRKLAKHDREMRAILAEVEKYLQSTPEEPTNS
jgi:hypothetical protein